MKTLTASQARAKETMYLLSIPGMRKALLAGMMTPLSKCKKQLRW